jgi:hypothetical protein
MRQLVWTFLTTALIAGCSSHKSVMGNIPVDGGRIVLEDEAMLTVAKGTFSQATNFDLDQRPIIDFEEELNSTSRMAGSQLRNGVPLRVTIDAEQPILPILVSLRIPPTVAENLKDPSDLIIFAASETESDYADPIAYFDLLSGTVSESGDIVTFVASPSHFVLSRKDDGDFFGVFIVSAEDR